jgi:hypothetical protein
MKIGVSNRIFWKFGVSTDNLGFPINNLGIPIKNM